ncbi:MAG TPA: hypothetical protein VHE14_05450 [Solirubrobacteraceae bacterium]|nr:hypothetical protein [Solirubrobacteraceae bacterium]
MSNTAITYLVAACAGVFSFAAFVAFVLAPAWSAYTRAWERVAVTLLSIYVLAALMIVGVLLGVLIVLSWNRLP